ncbi:MAG: pirin family protein [Deltaproteobacteria bacterium]|nr:pirin family protein [Deltaproteobacteria bacterium]
MIQIRKSSERGHFNHGWLDTYHTFSFADYHDPSWMGFSVLRVINEDRVAPGKGFGTHPHRDMEILTYVVQGSLEHKDSMGNGSLIVPGEIQRMSAGLGVTHSEFNPSKTEPVHLLQIWILPDKKDHPPSYEQKTIRQGKGLILIASNDGGGESVRVHQDIRLFRGNMDSELKYQLAAGRSAWIQIVSGEVNVNGAALLPGDGAGIRAEKTLLITGKQKTEILLFDLPGK